MIQRSCTSGPTKSWYKWSKRILIQTSSYKCRADLLSLLVGARSHTLFGVSCRDNFFLGPWVVPSLAVWCWQCPKQGRANVEERAIVPVSAAEKWQLKCGCSCWARITTIAEWTTMGERTIVPVSDAKLLGPGLSTIFFWKHKNEFFLICRRARRQRSQSPIWVRVKIYKHICTELRV